MTGQIVAGVVAAIVLLLLLFFASMADAALRSLNAVRLRSLLDQGVRRADAINRLLDNPHRITATTLILNTLALAALAAETMIVALYVVPHEGSGQWLGVVGVMLVGFCVIVFCQLVPRALAVRNPEGIAIRITPLLSALYVVVSPIAWAAEGLANAVVRVLGVRNAPRSPFITEDDLRMLVNVGEEEGVIQEEEREMIAGILRFGDMEAHEVMVPRPDIVAVQDRLTVGQALDCALRAGHSRVPVYSENIDAIEGIVYTKDLIRAVMTNPDMPVSEIARDALFIPETKKLGELLQELQDSRVHIAIVVDEYGGTSGLVTIEDLLEEIVGEIQDEYDIELPDIEQVGPDEWVAKGGISLDDVNEKLGLSLNSEDYDTLGGYITAQLERLPITGDEVEVQGVRMRVLETERRRLRRVELKRVAPPETPEDERDGRDEGE